MAGRRIRDDLNAVKTVLNMQVLWNPYFFADFARDRCIVALDDCIADHSLFLPSDFSN